MLQLYNTMTRSIEEFKPRESNKVKIFTCGPSIYQKAHLGNYRTFLYEDLLVRYLRYTGYKTERSMNLTDIEDKAINEAKKNKTNVKSLTGRVLSIFRESLDGFGFLMPEHLIPASQSIEQSVKIIKTLVDKGIAYEHKGDYFFDPLKIENFGKLFGLDMSRWPKVRRRFSKDTYVGNRWNLGDFILWHNHRNDPDHPYWDTEIGRGRPSWNIQDPAIVTISLGDQIDINCGGIDNIYRHHDYNIAVMEGYTGKPYANYYMHGAHLFVDGKSMSKSRGNIIYPEDLAAEGVEWRDMRFFLTYTHYREKLNYTEKDFNKTVSGLIDFRSTVRNIKRCDGTGNTEAEALIKNIRPAFTAEMDNDLSLGKGFDAVQQQIKRIFAAGSKSPLSISQYDKMIKTLKEIDKVMNVIYPLGTIENGENNEN